MTLRFAIFGTGFWSRFQLAAWQELGGVECVALYNRTRSRAEALAYEFGVPTVYDDPEELLRREKIDFIDIITHVDAHSQLVHLAARYKIPVICQKPMAPDLETACKMVQVCQEAGIPFMVHENWRYQYPIQQVKAALQAGKVGKPFRAHIVYANSAPVFENHPYLKELDRFIIADMGSHLLDVARFLFGEAKTLYCRTSQITPGIKGEDVATVMMEMEGGVTVICALSYASRVEHDRWNETYMTIECDQGSIELGPDYWVRVTTEEGTLSRRYIPPDYDWIDHDYYVVQSSIVPCNADLLHSLQTGQPAPTSGEDNLKTMRLVFAAYDSAQTGQIITF
ncbi:MAG: Gfo/Idh/MocA family oxidoreductase [Anaerolineae bacterium]